MSGACDTYQPTSYDLAMWPLERLVLARLRGQLIAPLAGEILEIGVGTGVNLALYSPDARVTAIDARGDALAAARRRPMRACRWGSGVSLIGAHAEYLPFAHASFDHVVGSLVFCSLDDPDQALAEIKRVLRPGGTLALLEHVRGQSRPARWLTDALAAPWLRLSHGCHLDRETSASVTRAGLVLMRVQRQLGGIIQVIQATCPQAGRHRAVLRPAFIVEQFACPFLP